MLAKLFDWLNRKLEMTAHRQQSEWQFRSLEQKLIEIQSQLNAMQVDKLEVYVQDKAKPVAMDYESSQQAALDEFKDEK